MNFSTKKQNFLWAKVFIGVAILFILIGFLNFFQSQVRNHFYFISSPITKIFWRVGNDTSNFLNSFFNYTDLKQQNNQLKEENQKLLSEVFLLKENLKENQELNEVLQNTEKDDFKMVLAEITGLDIFNNFILIDRGSDDGVSENMPVISNQKVLYGKIFKAYKNFSKVILISSKNSVFDVKIQNNNPTETPIYGAIRGDGNLSVYLDLVSSESEIKEGDILITSALEGTFPENLLVGKIITKNKNDLKPFQTAEVHPFFDIKNTENLFVITNYLQVK